MQTIKLSAVHSPLISDSSSPDRSGALQSRRRGTVCGNATLQQGAPLTGNTSIIPDTATSPASFTVPRSALQDTTTGSLPLYSPHRYISTYVTSARNDAGFFASNGGKASAILAFPQSEGQPLIFLRISAI
jgi:hypothetical protein